jgi:hypothetical protein
MVGFCGDVAAIGTEAEAEEEEEAAAAAKQFAKLEAVVVVDIVLLESLPKKNCYTGRF